MNPLENLPPFYVGQKVVSLSNHESGLIKDKIYTVLAVIKGHCYYTIDIGLKNKSYANNLAKCTCGVTYKTSPSDIWWHSSARFAPLQESAFPTLTLSRVIEKELQLTSMN